jgi:hypothetical protein
MTWRTAYRPVAPQGHDPPSPHRSGPGTLWVAGRGVRALSGTNLHNPSATLGR